jgi:steroid 5-alpha reductase family enzyme
MGEIDWTQACRVTSPVLALVVLVLWRGLTQRTAEHIRDLQTFAAMQREVRQRPRTMRTRASDTADSGVCPRR